MLRHFLPQTVFLGESISVHQGWADLWAQIQPLLRMIEQVLLASPARCTPPVPLILRCLQIDPATIRVVILGQDPYPQAGVATGRAFEVGGIESWLDLGRNRSLVNIVKCLHANDCGLPTVASFAQVKSDLRQGVWCPLSPTQLFDSWESQGVWLLNAALTCEVGVPNSHRLLWQPVLVALLQAVHQMRRGQAVWCLWGRDARQMVVEAGLHLTAEQCLLATHPALIGVRADDPLHFFTQNHFLRLAKQRDIDWTGVLS